MLSSVLRSERTVRINIAIMRVFVRLKEMIATHKELAHKLTLLEKRMEKKTRKFRLSFSLFVNLWRYHQCQRNLIEELDL